MRNFWKVNEEKVKKVQYCKGKREREREEIARLSRRRVREGEEEQTVKSMEQEKYKEENKHWMEETTRKKMGKS